MTEYRKHWAWNSNNHWGVAVHATEPLAAFLPQGLTYGVPFVTIIDVVVTTAEAAELRNDCGLSREEDVSNAWHRVCSEGTKLWHEMLYKGKK